VGFVEEYSPETVGSQLPEATPSGLLSSSLRRIPAIPGQFAQQELLPLDPKVPGE